MLKSILKLGTYDAVEGEGGDFGQSRGFFCTFPRVRPGDSAR